MTVRVNVVQGTVNFYKTLTSVIYKCSYCFQTLKQWLQSVNHTCKSFIKLTHLNRAVLDSDWRFDNLFGSHPQSQSELYHVSWCYQTLLIDLSPSMSRFKLITKENCPRLTKDNISRVSPFVLKNEKTVLFTMNNSKRQQDKCINTDFMM